jgi:hypothetical protein
MRGRKRRMDGEEKGEGGREGGPSSVQSLTKARVACMMSEKTSHGTV